MHPLKIIADGLTWLRGGLALAILGVALVRGPAGFELGLTLLVVAWITDGLDGALARRSGQPGTTWIGRHDPLIDIALAVAVGVLLTAAGLVHPLATAVYLGGWGVHFWRRGGYRTPEPAIFGGIIYGLTLIQALRLAPPLGWTLIVWLVSVSLASWRRMVRVKVPAFFEKLGRLLRPSSKRKE